MHPRLAVAGVAIALSIVVGLIDPSAADGPMTGSTSGPVATDNGFLTGVESSYNEINKYTEKTRVPCTESVYKQNTTPGEQPGEFEDVEGYLRWVEPQLGQATWRDVYDQNSPGWMGRLECFVPGRPDIDGFRDVVFFPQITPVNLARLAVAQALTGVPAPSVRMEPGFESQLVNFDTWIYVDGIPFLERQAPTLSVPGMSVSVTVKSSGVWLNMGDGSGFPCTGLVDAESGPDCSYKYTKSSAHQSDLRFHGSASIRWTAEYSVNGGPVQTAADAVVYSTPFSTRVAEGQAVVTGG